MTRPHKLTAAALGLVAALWLTGCGSDDEPAGEATPSEATAPSETVSESPSETPSQSPDAEPAGTVIPVTIEGGKTTPSGKRVEVALGEPVTLDLTADVAGELHVHSTPEQELSYDAGHQLLELALETPGVVDVEDHHLGVVIVQLEVR